jgi:hypothetical protein
MAKREFDALERIVMAFDEPDPIVQIKQAMRDGQIKEASAMVNRLTAEQIDKLALELSTVGPPDNSAPESEQPEEHKEEKTSENVPAEQKPETGCVETASEVKSPEGQPGGLNAGNPDNSVSGVEKDAAAEYQEAYLRGARKAITKLAMLVARKGNASDPAVKQTFGQIVNLISK